MNQLACPAFLNLSEPVLDVRSPAEYEQGHIPGAISFPIFTNEERAQVGTVYKQEGSRQAVKLGLKLLEPKMHSFVERAERIDSERFSVYCWRGGMRSGGMGWLLELAGFQVSQLVGGYKAYRQEAPKRYMQLNNLLVITGFTGVGKTEVLWELQKQGAQVVDLEGLARHPGSSFGNQISLEQPTTEMFQNQLFEVFRKMDLSKPIYIEDESFCIGQVHMPEELFVQMRQSPRILLQIDRDERVSRLVNQYGQMTENQLIEATKEIQKKLGEESASYAIDCIKSGNLTEAASTLLTYYDRQYEKGLSKHQLTIKDEIIADGFDAVKLANEIITMYGS